MKRTNVKIIKLPLLLEKESADKNIHKDDIEENNVRSYD
jgi:hypothetical protein